MRISQQIGAQNSRGTELAVALTPIEGWRIEANAAYTHAWYGQYAESLGTGIISRTGNAPANVPAWVTSLFVIKRLPNGFAINSGARYVSDRFANNNNSVIADGYVTLDMGLSYTQNRWTVSLRGRNLLNAEYEPVAGTTMRRLADPHSVECSTRYLF